MGAIAWCWAVFASRSVRRNLQLLQVESPHVLQRHGAILPTAELEERHLQGRAPREAQIPRRIALDLVDGIQPRSGILQILPTTQEIHAADCHWHYATQCGNVRFCDLLYCVGSWATETRVHHVGLQDATLHVHAVLEHRFVESSLHLYIHCNGSVIQ